MARSKGKRPTDIVYTTSYEAARVVTVKRRHVGGKDYYRSAIHFEGREYAHSDTSTRREAREAHDMLGAYCLGVDQRVEIQVARARANALAEIATLLRNMPIERAREVEEIRALERQARMLRDNLPRR